MTPPLLKKEIETLLRDRLAFTRLRADAPQLAAGRKREVTAPKPWRRRVSRSGGVPLDFVTDAPQLAAGSFTV
jgi:hypothetical protein